MSDMLFAWLLVCCGAVLCQVKDTSRIQIIDEDRNWWEAQSRCEDNGGRLYTPGTDDIPAELWTRLQRSTSYWIGGIAYWVWRWTDDSPLFTYAGFLSLRSVAEESNRTFRDNSVWKCHLHCSSAYSVGMKGTTCYCLGGEYNTTDTSKPEERCPGNLEERCGNMHGMSVYKLENVTFNQEEDTYCAFVEDTDLSIRTSSYDDCMNKTDCYACFALSSANTSISCTPQKSWFDAEKACDLVKLNTSARTSLLGSSETTTAYFGGLYKYLHRKWINGKTASKYMGDRGASSSDTRCLRVHKRKNGKRRLKWRPCSEKIKFLCEDVNIPTSSTQSSSSTTSTTVINHRGSFIGLGVGCLQLLLTVLIVVYLMRRRKRKRDVNHPVHFTSAAENITCGLAADAQTDSETYAVITLSDTADETPASSTTPTAIVRPSVHSDSISTSQTNDENEYNVLSTSNTSKVPVSHWNPYNHLSEPDTGNKYNGDYDTTHFVPQKEGEVEVTTGMKITVTHPRLPDVSSGQVFQEKQYNVLGQHDSPRTDDAGVYGHLSADEGDYDTARWEKNASEVDDSYSHVQKAIKPCQEDTYDVTSKGQSERRADDTYNHVVKVEDGRGNTTDYCNTRRLLDNGKLEGHMEGDDEFNRGGQENVYSLARDISDA